MNNDLSACVLVPNIKYEMVSAASFASSVHLPVLLYYGFGLISFDPSIDCQGIKLG